MTELDRDEVERLAGSGESAARQALTEADLYEGRSRFYRNDLGYLIIERTEVLKGRFDRAEDTDGADEGEALRA